MPRMYRIHTQHTNEYQRNAETLMGRRFDSFNIVRGTGYWRGQREDSMTIEYIAESRGLYEIILRQVAEEIRVANNQEAVYITVTDLVGLELIQGDTKPTTDMVLVSQPSAQQSLPVAIAH